MKRGCATKAVPSTVAAPKKLHGEQVWTQEDFNALHHAFSGKLKESKLSLQAFANSVEPQAEIPDEEGPLVKMFKDIISRGIKDVLEDKETRKAKIIVVGGGPASLCAAYELKWVGLEVVLLEASHRVGGRVKTIFDPFTPNLHGEGGAMRLPANHTLVRLYLTEFDMNGDLEDFTQENKIIHISTYGRTITYDQFNNLLCTRNAELLLSFPGLKEEEKGKTIDELWDSAIQCVVDDFCEVYQNNPDNIAAAYQAITKKFDQYSLQTYFEQIAGWSQDCISLYDIGSPHVVLDNAFIESWKDAFLSSQQGGQQAQMQQMKNGMQEIPFAFANSSRPHQFDIRYGARVVAAKDNSKGVAGKRVEVIFETLSGLQSEFGDYVVFSVPLTVQRLIKVSPTFSIPKMNSIRDVRYVEVTKILLQFKTRWWEQYLENLGQGTSGGMVTDLPIHYLMFPPANSAQFQNGEKRGVIMASYTFQEDATISGAMASSSSVKLAADNMTTIFGKEVIETNLEVGTSQVWSADSFSGGSAFAYFGPMQKTRLFSAMIEPDWNGVAHFCGEHSSYSHGWIEGALESALRATYQVYADIMQEK
jgi:monoamine oxidase